MAYRKFVYVTSVPEIPNDWDSDKEDNWTDKLRTIVHSFEGPSSNQPWLDDSLFAKPRKISKRPRPSDFSEFQIDNLQQSKGEASKKYELERPLKRNRIDDWTSKDAQADFKNSLQMCDSLSSSSDGSRDENFNKRDFQRPQKKLRRTDKWISNDIDIKSNNPFQVDQNISYFKDNTNVDKPSDKNVSFANIMNDKNSLCQPRVDTLRSFWANAQFTEDETLTTCYQNNNNVMCPAQQAGYASEKLGTYVDTTEKLLLSSKNTVLNETKNEPATTIIMPSPALQPNVTTLTGTITEPLLAFIIPPNILSMESTVLSGITAESLTTIEMHLPPVLSETNILTGSTMEQLLLTIPLPPPPLSPIRTPPRKLGNFKPSK